MIAIVVDCQIYSAKKLIMIAGPRCGISRSVLDCNPHIRKADLEGR